MSPPTRLDSTRLDSTRLDSDHITGITVVFRERREEKGRRRNGGVFRRGLRYCQPVHHQIMETAFTQPPANSLPLKKLKKKKKKDQDLLLLLPLKLKRKKILLPSSLSPVFMAFAVKQVKPEGSTFSPSSSPSPSSLWKKKRKEKEKK